MIDCPMADIGPAYRGRGCDGYHTLLTGTTFEKTPRRPATLVLLPRQMAKGEPTARLARELKQVHMLRHRPHGGDDGHAF
jgi:hypothetical protein